MKPGHQISLLSLLPDVREYGVDDLYVGVPVIIGAKGVEKIIEIKFNPEGTSCATKALKAEALKARTMPVQKTKA